MDQEQNDTGMKRHGHLWDRIVSWENLVLAARKAQRGKRSRDAVQRFNHFQEYELFRLARELDEGTYTPGSFRTHWIDRPKPRMISAAPYRDRVVHHALMNVLEPILDRHMHPHSYACRKGKGTHAAADQMQHLMRGNRWLVQCDIRKFFPSIDHVILKDLFRRLVKDERTLKLMDLTVDRANEQEQVVDWFAGDDLFTPVKRRRGLPIGNLTSQWFANWYLTPLDHFVTSKLRIGGYVRYCDDFVMFHDERERLKAALDEVKTFLAGFRLRMHEHRLHIRRAWRDVRFVGFRLRPTHRTILKDNVVGIRRRVRWMRQQYAGERIDWKDIQPRLASWLGHARQANSERLIRRVSRDWVFARGGA